MFIKTNKQTKNNKNRNKILTKKTKEIAKKNLYLVASGMLMLPTEVRSSAGKVRLSVSECDACVKSSASALDRHWVQSSMKISIECECGVHSSVNDLCLSVCLVCAHVQMWNFQAQVHGWCYDRLKCA